MRTTLFAAVAALAFNAHAGTFELDPTQYWQVQNADTYETVCEGFISSCDVIDAMAYNVINHSTGERLENQVAPNEPSTQPTPTGRISCEDRTLPLLLLSDGPSAWEGQPALECELTCPTGTTLVPISCNAFVSYSLGFDANFLDYTSRVDGLATSLRSFESTKARCELYGQYESYLTDITSPDVIPERFPVLLEASAICLK